MYTRQGCSTAYRVFLAMAFALGIPLVPASAAPTPAPTGLTATGASASQIHLSWADNSTREKGFVIERSSRAEDGFVKVTKARRDQTLFDDTALTAATTYYYRVKAISKKGPSPYSNVASAATLAQGANVPPIANAGVDQQAPTLTVISLDGSGSSDPDGTITSYAWDFGDHSTGSGQSVTHSFARPGVYSVRLTVRDNGGATGSTVTTVRADNRAPVASAGANQWTDPQTPILFEGVGSTDPDGSIVSYDWEFGDGSSATGMVVSHLFTSTGAYPVTFTVMDDVGAMTSDTVTVTVSAATLATMLSAPTVLAATPISSARIALSWTDNSPDETGFKIERSTSPSGPWSQLATTLINARSYLSVWLEPSTAYYYRIRAFSASQGNSDYSNTASSTTMGAGGIPSAPTGLVTSAMSFDQVDLTWTDTSINELGFKVERATSASGPFVQIATTVSGGHSDTGLNASTTCYYRVRAYNATGDSQYTSVVAATTPSNATSPMAPSTLSAAAASPRQISLAWADRSNDETGFKIERSVSGSGQWAQIAVTGSNVTGYSDAGLAPSSGYDYRVRAYNAVGDSTYSSTASASTPAEAVVPFSPSNLTATPLSSTRVDLTWTDGSTNEGGFKIERASSVSGPFTTLTSTGPNVVSYSNTGLIASTPYHYRVSAYNATGESSRSNTASATTSGDSDRTAPSAPTAPIVTAPTCGLARLTWNGSADAGGSGLKGYNVYRMGTFFQHVPASAATSMIDSGLQTATYYYYAVSAVDNAGNESARTSSAGTYTQSCSGSGGDYRWARTFGGSVAPDSGQAIAVDRDGSVFVTGEFKSTADLGGQLLTSAGYRDVFVAKYRADGTHVWSLAFGGLYDDFSEGIGVDANGDVVISGLFLRTVDFGGGPLTSAGGYDTFLVKLSGLTGSHIWSKRVGGTGDDRPSAVVIDGAGSIVITGQFNGTSDFGNGVPTSANNATRAYVAKYAGTDGANVWARVFESTTGANNFGSGQGVAVDGTSVVVTGYFQGLVDFGGGALTSAGGLDVFVAKFTSAGAYIWSRAFGDASDQHGQAVAMDSESNIILTGDFQGSADFGGGSLPSSYTTQTIFLASLNPDGSHGWSRSFTATGLNGGSYAYGLAVDSADRIVITGIVAGPVDLGGGPMGVSTIFLAKYTGGGTHVWSKSYRSGGGVGRGVAIALDGSILATGTFTTVVGLGGGDVRSNGSASSDAFVLSLAP